MHYSNCVETLAKTTYSDEAAAEWAGFERRSWNGFWLIVSDTSSTKNRGFSFAAVRPETADDADLHAPRHCRYKSEEIESTT